MSNHWDRIRKPYCKKCPLHEDTNIICSVTGKGSINSNILFICQGPDEEDEIRGLPLSGAKGREFLHQLMEADWDFPYAIAPALCCRPSSGRIPKLAAEVRVCRNHYLTKTIEQMDPKLIVCLGVQALKAVTSDNATNIKNTRRRIREVEFSVRRKKVRAARRQQKIPVVVTFDPGAVLRSPHLRQIVVEDLMWIQRVAAGEKFTQDKGDLVYVLQGRDEDLGGTFGNKPSVSIDIETTCISPWEKEARILCVSASDMACHATAFPLSIPHLRERFKDVLQNKRITKIGHNILFDLTWLRKNGYKIRGPVFDTQVAFHMLNENYPDKTLDHLANLFLPGMEDYAGDMKGARGSFVEVDEKLLEYCAADADAARRLRDRFYSVLRKGSLLRAFKLRMRTLKTLVDVQCTGLRIDRERVSHHSRLNLKERRRVKKWFRENLKRGQFNPNSSQQVQRLLYGDLALIPPVFSKTTKKPSANEKALRILERDIRTAGLEDTHEYQVISHLLAWRSAAQLEKMFLKPFRETHIRRDSRIHPSFQLAGTVTGRLACRKPNVQQIPDSLRDIVVSRFEGGSIIKADFSQMELRVLAHCSQEDSMLEVFNSGGDIHTATASTIFGRLPQTITKEERYLAKTVNFGIIYGMSGKRLAAETGMRYAEAAKFLRAYWKGLPKVKRWMDSVKDTCRRKGYVTSLFGVRRRLTIDDEDSYQGAEALREAVNHVIQSSASDITLVALNEVHWFLRKKRASIINVVHDEITIDTPPEELDEVALLVNEIGESPPLQRYGINFTVPLQLEVAVGPTWKDGVVINGV